MDITYGVIIFVVAVLIGLVIAWKVFVPRLMDKERQALHDILDTFYNQEVKPMQDALLEYPEVIGKMQDEIDALYSEGQQKPRESFDKIDALPTTRPKA